MPRRASAAGRESRSCWNPFPDGHLLRWTERILEYPVRAAAVDAFLEELRRQRSADLNGVLVTLNDGSLCREALSYWLLKQWIVVAPHSPLTALPGPGFSRDLTLRELCGGEPAESQRTLARPVEEDSRGGGREAARGEGTGPAPEKEKSQEQEGKEDQPQ